LNLQQLEFFQKVAKTGSLSQASKELFISQTTISQSIKRLEDGLGIPLFTHHPGKPLELNEAGRKFLAHVETVFKTLNEGITELQDSYTDSEKHIAFSCCVQSNCREALYKYIESHPDLCISEKNVSINDSLTLLSDGQIDFAIVPCPVDSELFDCHRLYIEKYLAVVGKDHPFCGKKNVTLSDLSGQCFLCNHLEIDRYFLEMLFDINIPNSKIVLESNDRILLLQILNQRTDVVLFLPERSIPKLSEYVTIPPSQILEISDYDSGLPTCIIKKKTSVLSFAANNLYQFLISFFQFS